MQGSHTQYITGPKLIKSGSKYMRTSSKPIDVLEYSVQEEVVMNFSFIANFSLYGNESLLYIILCFGIMSENLTTKPSRRVKMHFIP